ncbi:MAG: hypothetical protein E2O82_03685 [Betaproteobacteria bacterium]|nr:MAG: hypothetical protein E2O82_03685 [Betaproteobacteria bacterium]
MLPNPIGKEEPDELDILNSHMRMSLLEINTCMPAVVKSYDAATRTATVQPAFKITFMNNKVKSRPSLVEVPVVFPYNGSKGITFPLEPDTPCLLVFSQRSIDDWVKDKVETEVQDTRLHDISDAFCIPGISAPSDSIESKDAFQITHDKIWIGDKESDPLPLSGLENTELVAIVAKTLEQLETPLQSSMGPVTFDPAVAAILAEMKDALEALIP